MDDEDLLLTVKEAAAAVRLAPSTLDKMRTLGTGPEYSKLGGRIFYSTKALARWIQSRTRTAVHTTSDGITRELPKRHAPRSRKPRR
ncbi:MAG: helix-turn-helix domain-containing protein [Gemmatimonadaceae bacterium]|nr:helix-turn-helix domain-containing protein [Gemmatimonadaceae bacterium]